MDNRYRYKPLDVRIDVFHHEVDELIENGDNILMQLRNQRETFRSIERRFSDILQNLGMSRTVMNLIRRRFYTDKLIFYAGAIAIILFMTVVYFYYL